MSTRRTSNEARDYVGDGTRGEPRLSVGVKVDTLALDEHQKIDSHAGRLPAKEARSECLSTSVSRIV